MLKSYSGTSAAIPSGIDDFEQVVADPAAFYADPASIVSDAGLTRTQRLRLLGEWAQDLVDRQVAENEGMAPEIPGAGAAETTLLRQVNAAIEHVEAAPEANPNLMTRVWRRLTAI